jgi:hypothetical protein
MPGRKRQLWWRLLAGCVLLEGACSKARRGPRVSKAPTLPPRSGPAPIQFVDGTADAGIDFVHDSGFNRRDWHYIEEFGSGVVAFDADGDDDVDLLFLTGHSLTAPVDAPRPSARFFRNDGSGRFVDATASSGLGDSRYASGACVADYDNDGDLDVYVTLFDAGNALWRNDGSGRFEDVAAAAGALGRQDAMDSACAFVDVDSDGHVDLYVGGCLDHTRSNNPICHRPGTEEAGAPERIFCPPRTFRPLPDLLLRNRGDGTFEDFTAEAGLAALVGRTLGVAFSDLDDDGDQDGFITCDNTPNFMLRNDGRGRFTEVGASAGVAFGTSGEIMSGMGVASGHLDRDLRPDLVATYFEREPNAELRNLGGLRFIDFAEESGSAPASWRLLGWGTALADFDADGHQDWIVANGHTQPFGRGLEGYQQPLLLLLNRGDGRFEPLGAAAGTIVARRRADRALALADFDRDGDLDVVLNNSQEPAELLRNESPRDGRHWSSIRLVGTASNRAAIGARVTLAAGGVSQVRDVFSGQSFFSQSDLRVHFGLGAATTIDAVEVRWPSGKRSRHEGLAADRAITLTEP